MQKGAILTISLDNFNDPEFTGKQMNILLILVLSLLVR